MAKLVAREMVERVCSAAMQIMSGYEIFEGYPIHQVYREVRVCKLYKGANRVQRLVSAPDLVREKG